MDAKLAGRTSEVARDWKKSKDSNGVYADRGGIPHCPPGRPLEVSTLGIGATMVVVAEVAGVSGGLVAEQARSVFSGIAKISRHGRSARS